MVTEPTPPGILSIKELHMDCATWEPATFITFLDALGQLQGNYHQHFADEDVTMPNIVAPRSAATTMVHLYNPQLSQKTAPALKATLSSNTSLTSFGISGARLAPEAVQELAAGLRAN